MERISTVSCWLAVLLALAAQQPTGRLQSRDVGEFVDVTAAAGISFVHFNGASPEKYVIETMGSGVAWLDYDNDGWLDLYLVNGGGVHGQPAPAQLRHALYRNQRDGTFADVTAASGTGGNGRYGMGVTVGDYDRDGWSDLYVTAYGGNVLYRNRGDGTFADETQRAGVAGGGWSSSAAFFDYDNDGDLDLFVARYVDFAYERNRICGDQARGIRAYCHPDVYEGMPSLLYRNNGEGTFTDVSAKAGISQHAGKALGVVAADFDGDGWTDVYVANDSIPNFLFRNRGDGTFEEIGVRSGAALDDTGRAQAGMGVAAGDYDGDGRLDLVVTNLDRETNNLYRNLGRSFTDESYPAGVAAPSLPLVGWGTAFVDHDNDGDLDLFVVNGHVIDNIHLLRPDGSYAQPKLVLENTGRKFLNVTARHGAALTEPAVSRGAAFGDFDNDGDVDVAVQNLGGRPQLLRNDGGNRNHWLLLELHAIKAAPHGLGAVVLISVEGTTRMRAVAGGGSYLSASDLRVHVGLGGALRAERVEVRWPSGATDVFQNLAGDRIHRLTEGTGKTSRAEPLPR